MYNNGDGGCGNDLAIDDIIFRSCGDLTRITSEDNNEEEEEEGFIVCEPDVPVSLELIATPDNSVYQEHAFQWQERVGENNWKDIPGETGKKFIIPSLVSSKYYRVKVVKMKLI